MMRKITKFHLNLERQKFSTLMLSGHNTKSGFFCPNINARCHLAYIQGSC
jgi:hypothetical protein